MGGELRVGAAAGGVAAEPGQQLGGDAGGVFFVARLVVVLGAAEPRFVLPVLLGQAQQVLGQVLVAGAAADEVELRGDLRVVLTPSKRGPPEANTTNCGGCDR